MRRVIIVEALILLAVIAIGGIAAYLIYNNYNFYSTDDAQVTGSIVNITTTTPGTLNSLAVKVGDRVSGGQTIGTINVSNNKGGTTSVNLTAPIAGTILQVPAVVGQVITPGVPLAQETDLSNVTITAYVDEGALDNISTGQSVDIKVDAYSGTSFTGHVNQIVNATAGQFSLLPTQDNASGNFTKVGQRIPVIITLDGNVGKTLMPGMSATVTIHLH
jgi:multidrug resistance efflux pump